MTRFGHNVSKSGGSKHRVNGSSSTTTVNQPDNTTSSTAGTPFASSMPSYTAAEAARLRRAIRRCRPLLVKDLDPVDVVDAMSAVTPTAATAALRTETVRESMLGLTASREDQTVAFLDRLESVCFEADGSSASSSSSANLSAFVVTLRRNYRHVYAVLMETIRQIAEEEADDDESDYINGDDGDAAGNGDNMDDDGDRRDRMSEVGRLSGTVAGERRCRRERVAIAGDSVRKLLRRVTAANSRNGRHRSRNGLFDGTGSASSAEMLDEDHMAGAGGRSTYYYSSVSAAMGTGNAGEYLDCYVVPSRGRLQRRAPWIHHASSACGVVGGYGTASSRVDDVTEDEPTTYMAVLTKDLIFRRIGCSSITPGIRLPPPAPTLLGGSGSSHPSAYVVDEESQYSPVATDHSASPQQTMRAVEKPPQQDAAAAGNNAASKDVVLGEDCPPPPPVRTSSTTRSLAPPPPLPPKPQNLPSRSGSLQRQTASSTTLASAAATPKAPTSTAATASSSPPLPARQQGSPSMNGRTTPTPSCEGRPRQPPPAPIPQASSPPAVESEAKSVTEEGQNRDETTTAAERTPDVGETDYEPISDNGGETLTASAAAAPETVPSDSAVVIPENVPVDECRSQQEQSVPNNDASVNDVSNQSNSPKDAVEVIRRTSHVENADEGHGEGGDSSKDGDVQQQWQRRNRPPATRDSGIDSIMSSNGCNESPISQTGSAFAVRGGSDDGAEERRGAKNPLLARANGITSAPSLSDILISIDDDAEEFLRRQSRIEDDIVGGLRLLPRASLQYEDDYSYYEDIDLLDGADKLQRNATYLDPRSTSFNSADGVAMRRRSIVPPFSRASVVMRRTPSAASQLQQSTAPPLSSLAFFMQPDVDRKVLPAGTLLIAETVLADSQPMSSAVGDSKAPLMKSKTNALAASREETVDAASEDGKITATTPAKSTSVGSAFRQTVLCHDREGLAYYVPVEALGRHGDPTDEPWFFPIPLSARDATLFLQREDQRGCFLVYRPSWLDERRVTRRTSSAVVYNLSVGLGRGGDVVHYPIVRNRHGDVAIAGHDHSFLTVGELITYFRRNQSRLATRLGRSLREARLPIAAGCHYPARFELRRPDLSLTREEVRRTRFGPVVTGRFWGQTGDDAGQSSHSRGGEPVIVKVLELRQSKPEDDDDFVEEALVLMGLRHDNVARFIGISCTARPFYVVSEWSERGTLADCLRSGFLKIDDDETPINDGGGSRRRRSTSGGGYGGFDSRFDVCVQVSSALLYLESRRYVLHRAVAARSVIVCADDPLVKLANFDRARFVSDDDFQADPEEAVFVRWAAPEVLAESRYSTKSDAWALGVLFWEIFSGGAEPYASMDAERTAVYVAEGGRLERPPGCHSDIYSIMRSLWRSDPDERPSFAALHDKIRGESSIYYTCPTTAPPPPPTTASHTSSWAASAIGRSVSDDDRPPPPLPPPLNGRPQKSATLLPLPKKAKSPTSKPTTPTSRRPLLIDVAADRAPRTPSTTRMVTPAGAAASANASNSASSDSSSVISASTTTVTGNGGGDEASGAACEDLTRGEKIRKSLRKLITNKKPSSKQ